MTAPLILSGDRPTLGEISKTTLPGELVSPIPTKNKKGVYKVLINTDKQEEQAEQEQHKPREDHKKPVNPRLVFNDPDRFFLDLIMEQSEQG